MTSPNASANPDGPADPLAAAMESRDRDIPLLVSDALREGRARLALQPIKAAASNQVVFYEALIRLMDEAGRTLPAAKFMPFVEETALGRDLDCAGLRLALGMLVKNPSMRISVNMSARSIADGAWRRTLDLWLEKHPDAGARLILEMSEASAMLLPEITIRFMEEIQPRGVCFALDDFGSGVIAFKHLKDFFFDLVKIDRAYGFGIDTNPDNQTIAEALLSIARQFEMFSVAQGIERAEEAELFKSLGADCLQGFFVGRPDFNP